MENKVSAWKGNLNAGIILGLIGIIWTLVLWFLDQSMNRSLGWIFFVVLIIGLFFGIKSYRDKYRNGFITYGQSLGAGVIIMLYYSLISAVFTYILYKFIDPNLVDKMLALTEEQLVERGLAEGMIEQSMQMQMGDGNRFRHGHHPWAELSVTGVPPRMPAKRTGGFWTPHWLQVPTPSHSHGLTPEAWHAPSRVLSGSSVGP